MRRILLSAMTVCLSSAVAAAAPVKLVEGQEAPWIAAFAEDGSPVTLASQLALRDTRGVVVQFWASWCKACVSELEQLKASRKKLDDAKIKVLLINVLEDSSVAKSVIDELGLGDLPQARDRTGAVARAVGLLDAEGEGEVALPLTLAINIKNEIKLVSRGAGKGYVDRLIAALEKEPMRGERSGR